MSDAKMRKMALRRPSRLRCILEDILYGMASVILAVVFFIGFIHLPDYFDWRDGYHEGRTIYGLRG